MNNIEKDLQELRQISPDPAYVRTSRARLMMAAASPKKVTFGSLLAGMLRSGSAMAAIGLLLFFAVGGSAWKVVIGPVAQLARWDSNTLLAEAQAIDTQIHLTDLQYNDPGYERQRLISPKTNFNSMAILPDPKAPKPTPTVTIASSTEPAPEDTAPTSTIPAEPEDTNATSTPDVPPKEVIIDAKEAFNILSR